jgi:hypothetical protein
LDSDVRLGEDDVDAALSGLIIGDEAGHRERAARRVRSSLTLQFNINPSKVAPVGCFACFAPAVALALDELGDVAGHLGEEQTHRDIGQGQADGQRQGEGENHCGDGEE